jgi:membrane protease YdiL (CAAX protease family)
MLILSIATANALGTPLFYIFYTGVYGLLLSVIVPVIYVHKSKESLASLGIKRLRKKQVIVIFIFVVLSIAGQLVPLHLQAIPVHYELLQVCVIPLILTTFFEEFLFRGFMQSRFEKEYGTIPTLLLSGLMFSLYHIGYPGFRTMNDLLILWTVGLGFALSFKLSGNNLIVSYLVNLPNAFVTYILKSKQFPVAAFTSTYSWIAVVCIVCIGVGLIANYKYE